MREELLKESALSEPSLKKIWRTKRTQSMTDFERGDVILVRFPFTSLAEDKKRPAAMTENMKTYFRIAEWKKAGLVRPQSAR